MKRIATKRTIYLLASLALALLLAILIRNNPFKADENIITQTKEVKISGQTYNITFTNVGKKTEIRLTAATLLSNKITLADMPTEFDICPNAVLTDTSANKYFCIISSAGVHSQKLFLFSFVDNKLELIGFQTELTYNEYVISDLPLFKFVEINNKLGLSVSYRDYDKDPLVDSIQYQYLEGDNVFIYDKKTDIQY